MTATCDLWITARDHDRLMAHLYPGDDDEHGAVLRASLVETSRGSRLLVSDVIPAEEGVDYVEGQIGYRALTPTFIHRQILACRERGQVYLAVHNHDCEDEVAFSPVDLRSHERGYPALLDIADGLPVGALVYGRRSVAADVWLPEGQRLALGEYRIIGSTLKRLYTKPRSGAAPARRHDRQVRMFGAAGQALLGEAKVAVIGLGGVGSLIAEQTARLGVGELVLVDNDVIEDTNLTRVVGATLADVESKLLKTQIAIRHIREARPDAVIRPVAGDVASRAVARELRDCDFIFLAADSMRARLVVNALTHQYFVPAVQLGAKVRPGDHGELLDVMSVIRHVRPGQGCLWCNGWIDATQLAIEAKSDQERKDQAYGVEEPNPSVISLNAVAAAHGLNDFLLDFLDLRSRASEHLYEHHRFLEQTVQRVIPRRDPGCRECVRRFGRGDALELPSMSK